MSVLLVASQTAVAADLCPATEFKYSSESALNFDPEAPVQALADSIASKDGVISLLGQTVITYQNRKILAENATYKQATGEVNIDGELQYESDGVRLKSTDAAIDLNSNTFSTGDSLYEVNLGNKSANGKAAAMSRSENGLFKLTSATYSTCPPGDKSWFIRADSIILDSEEGIGTAKDIRLVFKGVPLLAVPRFSFPISPKRKTGFLAPILASNDSTGFELHVPWYWNIRPNLDATITPRFMTKKGTQLQGELRYLNDLGIWILDTEYLYDSDMPTENRHRQFTRIRHEGNFGLNFRSALDASSVSDKTYFEDLGDALSIASITHLERRGDLIYEDGNYSFLARIQSFQTVDDAIGPTERPYRRLPQFLFTTDWPKFKFGAKPKLDAELVYFDRSASVTGTRFDLHPEISWPINSDAWFVIPTISARYTAYSLNNQLAGKSSDIDRTLTTASLDTGLYFDRATDNKGSVQTLEPRLFLLNVPFTEQSDIPLFDSGELDFNISQLFRENRFSGADRVADAKQASIAMTSRFIDGVSGAEDFRASVGQIFYFEDRKVTLDGTTDRREVSDFVVEVAAEIDENWLVRSNIQYNPDDRVTTKSSALVSYRSDAQHILNFAHRNIDTGSTADTEQIDFSFLWPLKDNWRFSGRWNYSLDSNSSIETMLGIEYESCCWAFRFATRRFVSDDGLDHDNSYYFQLVLKGLAPLGDNIGQLLGEGVFGYQDEY